MTDTRDSCDIIKELLCSDNGCEYTDVIDGVIEEQQVSGKLSLTVLHLNIRSTHKNSDQLTLLLSDLQEKGIVVHVLALCETFLTSANQALADIENYKATHSCRSSKPGGGISIYLHDRVRLVEVMNRVCTDSFESLTLRAKYKGHPFTIFEVYRPPNSDNADFQNHLSHLTEHTRKAELHFLCGDFNYDLMKTAAHKHTGNFLLFMLDNEFVPYVLKPTRITHQTSTLIDNIFVRTKRIRCSHCYLITDSMSDHYPCILSYNLATQSCKSDDTVIEKRKLTESLIQKIQQSLLFQDWSAIYNPDISVHDSYRVLSNIIEETLNEHAPK